MTRKLRRVLLAVSVAIPILWYTYLGLWHSIWFACDQVRDMIMWYWRS